MIKRTKNTGSMRANQESWFRSNHGDCACDLGLAKKKEKKPLELESLMLLLSDLGFFFFFINWLLFWVPSNQSQPR